MRVRRIAHSGMVRLAGIRAADQGPVCVRVLERYEAELRRGAIITTQAGRVRVRVRPGPDG